MGITSALFTGLSGLDVNQSRLGVVANNIANVNTVGFKSSRALFETQFYVTDNAGSSPNPDFGGTNPVQRGLGAQVASIDRDFSNGGIEPTGKATDMAIDGDGFFVVQGEERRFTRDGSFTLNGANQLVTAGGDFVQGYGADSEGTIDSSQLQSVTIPIGAATTARATTQATMQGNLNGAGALATGASILTTQLLTTLGGGAAPTAATKLVDLANNATPGTAIARDGDTFTLEGRKGTGSGRKQPIREFEVTPDSTLGELTTFLQGGLGINTDVPDDGNADTPTAGVTVEADGAVTTAARLVVTGNLGADNELKLDGLALQNQGAVAPFTFKEGENAARIKSNPVGESVHTTIEAFDSLGASVMVDVQAVLETKSNTGNTWRFYATSGDDTDVNTVLGTGTLKFDTDGMLLDAQGTNITINRNDTGAKEPLSIDLDFNGLTSLKARDSSLVMTEQDGYTVGVLNTFSIGADGKVIGSYSNGQQRNLAQIAVASFANNNGLVDKGGNQYAAGADSGVPIVSAPLELGTGAIRGASLEQSNVDLSKEFVNMIISSTGFSAASRVISTSDQLITELLNSSR